jgi:hypothetical protein
METNMQIGDRVKIVGTVRDIIGDNVLVVIETDDREYWFLAKHCEVIEVPPTTGSSEQQSPPEPDYASST